MQHCDTLTVPRWCVPVVPAGAVFAGHAVAVSEARIEALLPLEAWLREHIWPAQRRWVRPELVRDGAELAIAEMLRGGTTWLQRPA